MANVKRQTFKAPEKTRTSSRSPFCSKGSGVLSSKMGKCYQITHFLDLRGISPENSQPNDLITLEIKKGVPLVPLVPTVSFSTCYAGVLRRRGVEKLRVEEALPDLNFENHSSLDSLTVNRGLDHTGKATMCFEINRYANDIPIPKQMLCTPYQGFGEPKITSHGWECISYRLRNQQDEAVPVDKQR